MCGSAVRFDDAVSSPGVHLNTIRTTVVGIARIAAATVAVCSPIAIVGGGNASALSVTDAALVLSLLVLKLP
tara:strand:+ start:748 stop:963 length:216 start_codon:yes stop_codon:yes gene_type:complete